MSTCPNAPEMVPEPLLSGLGSRHGRFIANCTYSALKCGISSSRRAAGLLLWVKQAYFGRIATRSKTRPLRPAPVGARPLAPILQSPIPQEHPFLHLYTQSTPPPKYSQKSCRNPLTDTNYSCILSSMNTYQNPFNELSESDIARFHLYLQHINSIYDFAKAAQLSLADATRWVAQPIIDACIDCHTQRQLKLLTLDSLALRREVSELTLEVTKSFRACPTPQSPADLKIYIQRRHAAETLIKGLSTLTRQLSTNIAAQVRQGIQLLRSVIPNQYKPGPTKVVDDIEYYEPKQKFPAIELGPIDLPQNPLHQYTQARRTPPPKPITNPATAPDLNTST